MKGQTETADKISTAYVSTSLLLIHFCLGLIHVLFNLLLLPHVLPHLLSPPLLLLLAPLRSITLALHVSLTPLGLLLPVSILVPMASGLLDVGVVLAGSDLDIPER